MEPCAIFVALKIVRVGGRLEYMVWGKFEAFLDFILCRCTPPPSIFKVDGYTSEIEG